MVQGPAVEAKLSPSLQRNGEAAVEATPAPLCCSRFVARCLLARKAESASQRLCSPSLFVEGACCVWCGGASVSCAIRTAGVV